VAFSVWAFFQKMNYQDLEKNLQTIFIEEIGIIEIIKHTEKLKKNSGSWKSQE